ncbi:MAG: family 78 glycoside hydrolase catalytic domain [Candidatus Anammoximicrobium sp.]|nr:family 78 glycoside hydrolase catalytic domain [Candidatus Anammoximicrobium sp.]
MGITSVRCVLGIAALVATTTVAWAAGSLQVERMRCEYKTDPIGIDVRQPRLSWVLVPAQESQRGLKQSAYHILVASSKAKLASGQGDLWDSGKVASDQSVNVEYAGKKLVSAQDCFWKVRVWDQGGQECDGSPVGRWTMGLLQPEDWQAQWIGLDGGAESEDPQAKALRELLTFRDNSWFWTSGAKAGNQPAGPAYFRTVIEIPAGRKVAQAAFLIAADDAFTLYVNGHDSGNGHNWKNPSALDVTGRLQPGRNALGIRVTNGGTAPSPAGLMGKLIVLFQSGDPLVVPVDASWRSSRTPGERWKWADFDDRPWTASSAIARHGDQPWGELKLSVPRILPATYLRKAFSLDKPVARALLFASALGVYELHLNGKPLNSDVLSPGWTDYHKRVHYFGYDITSQLKPGDNVLGAILGDGWYAGYLAFSGRRNYYGDKTRLIAHLRLDFADGTSRVIATDGSWQAAYGPIREGDMLMGCVYDARLEKPGWCAPGGDATGWRTTTVDTDAKANLESHPGLPIRQIQELPAQEVTEPKPGVYVFNLGQNMVGWVRLLAKGSKGQKVVVRHAEMLNADGTIYTVNLRAAKATDTFYLDGGPKRAYEPYFTFHGFQYVEVTGLDYKPDLADVTGIVVHSDLPRTGLFDCSEPLVNKLVENTLWGQKGNFLDVPTDCPQRDERAGWTGDAQVFMKTACFNLDSPGFFTKWLTDLCQDSQRQDGGLGDVAPHVNIVGFGNTGWADAGVVCNWQMVQLYGDTRVVRRHYPALVRYMDYLEKTSKDFVRGTGSFGDWLRLAGPQHSEAIGTAYYFYSTRLMGELAAALGKSDDVQKYRCQAERIKAAFVKNFLKDDGRIVDGKGETGQTFYALAFGLDLVPPDRHTQVAQQFVKEIEKQGGHLATGFLGTPFVLFALEKAGQTDLAYQLLLNDTYPSWLLQVKLGSTTMWERWDGWLPDKGFQDPGMNSFNHYWLGCVGQWLQCSVAGIDTDGPGFARITIRPVLASPGKGLTSARGSYDSIRGRITSQWSRRDGGFRLDVGIPANTVATVYVPAKDPARVREGGQAIDRAAGVKFLRHESGYAAFEVGSGHYTFTSP